MAARRAGRLLSGRLASPRGFFVSGEGPSVLQPAPRPAAPAASRVPPSPSSSPLASQASPCSSSSTWPGPATPREKHPALCCLPPGGSWLVRSLQDPAERMGLNSAACGPVGARGKVQMRSFSAATECAVPGSTEVKRLLYRSKQRGILELDLLVGKWADNNIHRLDPRQLQDLTTLLDQESPDLLKWLLGQQPTPEHLAQNEVFNAIRNQVVEALEENANPETKASPGSEWVRGWGDIGQSNSRPSGAPPGGNQ